MPSVRDETSWEVSEIAIDDAPGDTRSTKRILIVDDDPATVRILRDVLGGFRHDHEYQIAFAVDGDEALAALERDRFDLVLLDIYMPGMSGRAPRGDAPPGSADARSHADRQQRRPGSGPSARE